MLHRIFQSAAALSPVTTSTQEKPRKRKRLWFKYSCRFLLRGPFRSDCVLACFLLLSAGGHILTPSITPSRWWKGRTCTLSMVLSTQPFWNTTYKEYIGKDGAFLQPSRA